MDSQFPREILGEIAPPMDIETLFNYLQTHRLARSLANDQRFWSRYFTQRYPSFNIDVLNLLIHLIQNRQSRLLAIFLGTYRQRGLKIPKTVFKFLLPIDDINTLLTLLEYRDVLPINFPLITENLLDKLLTLYHLGHYQDMALIIQHLIQNGVPAKEIVSKLKWSIRGEIEKNNFNLANLIMKEGININLEHFRPRRTVKRLD